MDYFCNDDQYKLELSTLLKVFYPGEEVILKNEEQSAYRIIFDSNHKVRVAFFSQGDLKDQIVMPIPDHLINQPRDLKHFIKGLLFDLAVRVSGYRPPWGILTGIRPTKLAFKLIGLYGKQEAQSMLSIIYRLDSEKIDLLMDVVAVEKQVIERLDKLTKLLMTDHEKYGDLREDYPEHREHHGKDLYIGIPFCPSRCSYCTFPSYSREKHAEAFCQYTQVLVKEVQAFSNYFKQAKSIYIGGGTPTSLTDKDFEYLLAEVNKHIEIKPLEFTVEAGRPDTIFEPKLKLMKKYGVTRISINPQTMQDKTLKVIGRSHSRDDVIRAFHLSRAEGFDDINMDIILGLPGENIEEVKNTLEDLIELGPESITVHSMALKRGSKLSEEASSYYLKATKEMEVIVSSVRATLFEAGYHPYYLYRQKNMVGQMENIGYCRQGYESIYNIQIMEDKSDIIAFGAGAISKKVRKRVERLDNPKQVEVYIDKIEDLITKKINFLQ